MSGAWSLYLLLLTAAVLVASGGLKFIDRRRFAAAVDGFKVLPEPVRVIAKPALPVLEIVLGLLLLLNSGSVRLVVAWVVTTLMVGFTLLVGVTLARGERPSCQCFGAVSGAQISGWTLLRNLGLVVLAGVVAVRLADGPGFFPALRGTTDDSRSGLALLSLVTAAVVVLWIRQDRIVASAGRPASTTVALAGQPPQPESLAEQPIPPLHLTSPEGVPVQLREMSAAKAQLLVYVSPTCSTCHQLVPLVADWQEMLGTELDVRLVSIGGRDDSAAAYPHQIDQMWIDAEQGYGRLGIPGTPSAVLLGNNEIIAAGPAAGVPAIQELLATIVQALGVNLMSGTSHQQQHNHPQAQATREEQAGWVPEPGKDLPELSVVRDDGTVDRYSEALDALAAEAGVDTLTTIAWRHDCGYCEEILEDVQRASASGSVVLVISEDPKTVRAQGLTGPVLQVMAPATAVEAVGVPGTPAAVPVSHGMVAGLGGVGGPHVLEVLAEYAGHGADA